MTTVDRRGVVLDVSSPSLLGAPNPDRAIKTAVRVATTGSNITLAGLLTIDAVTVAAGDRVLVKDQTDQTTNGIYVADAGTWSRSSDFQFDDQIADGVRVGATAGTLNGLTMWQVTSPDPITIGSSDITWAPASGGALTIAATPIAGGTNGRVLFNNDGVVGEYAISGTGNVAMTASPTFTGIMTTQAIAANAGVKVTSSAASALAVGLNGTTNPAFAVDASTALQAAGLKVKGAVTGGTVAVAAIDSGSNTNLTIDAKGTGTISIGSVSTGGVTIAPTLTINATGTVPALAINATGTTPATISSSGNTYVRLSGAAGARASYWIDGYGTNAPPGFIAQRSNGTPSAPTAVTNGQTLNSLIGRGYGATGFSNADRAVIGLVANETTWTDTAQGTQIIFSTAPVGGTSGAGADFGIYSAAGKSIIAVPSDATAGGVFPITTTGEIHISGKTSGTAILTVNDIAGSATVKIGTATGTLASAATAPLAIDATTGTLSLATTFTSQWTFDLGSGALPTLTTGTILECAQADTTAGVVNISTFGAIPSFQGRRAAGTRSSKTGVTSNTTLFQMLGSGYDGSAYGQGGGLSIIAKESWDSTHHGSALAINLVALGSTSAPSTMAQFLGGGGLYLGSSTAVDPGLGSLKLTGHLETSAPTTQTANYSVVATDSSIIFNGAGSITLTLQSAASYVGRWLYLKTIAAQTVVSASSNVVPVGSATAGTAILAATIGKWALLQSDGTNWITMAAN